MGLLQVRSSMGLLDVMSAVGSLLLIVAVIVLAYFASRWYARRMGVTGAGKYVKILDRTNLGNTSSLIIAEVGTKHYLIGVSDKNMQMLCELEDFEEYLQENPQPSSGQVPFGQMLRGLMDRGGGGSEKRDDEGTQ